MLKADRKAAIAEWRERKGRAGVFAFRCPAESLAWVGASPTLGSMEARLRFSLRTGDRTRPEMAAAYARHGDAGFVFEVLEELDEKTRPESAPRLLKSAKARWAEALRAKPL